MLSSSRLRLLSLAAFLALSALPLTSQETYWIANRRTDDIQEVDSGGVTLRSIPLSSNLRSAHMAPDGKVWVIRFIQSTFDIVDPTTGLITSVTHPGGSTYQVAFDRAGHGWVTAGSTVAEYDANGGFVNTYTVPANALGITVDSVGNKWIAHRSSPASVSRIDATTGAVTTHPFGVGTPMLPVSIIADYRGFASGQPSHIWVIGDSSGEVGEFDEQGNFLALHSTPLTSVSGITFDLNGQVWVNNRTGIVLALDTTGAVVQQFALGVTDSLGLATDFMGRIWVTDRITFSCSAPPCPPCEIKRIDPTTGAVEVPALAGYGTQAALSTTFAFATVVDPLGDMDGDGSVNIFEILNGTMPNDPQSNGLHIGTTGISQVGGQVRVDTLSLTPTTSSVLFSSGPAAPSTIGGIGGTFQMALPILVATPVTANSSTLTLPLPLDPSLAGVELFVQGLVLTGQPGFSFANRNSIRIW
jgi:streptogramin lyase